MDILNQYMIKYGLTNSQTFITLSYFDIKNLAERVTCPILMASSLQDPPCPPAINFAAYNLATSTSKQYVIFKANGHWSDASFLTYKDAWYQLLLQNTDVISAKDNGDLKNIRITLENGEIQIKSEESNPIQLSVFKLDGVEICKKSFNTFCKIQLPAGIYLVKLSCQNSLISKKIVVK
jgi:hypothetical protein